MRRDFDSDDGRSAPATDRAPCQRCQQSTPKATLGHLGAMCQGCYDDYCSMGRPPEGRWSKDDKLEALKAMRSMFTKTVQDPKAWAYALKAREESGERLSSVQRTMWRAAIASRARFQEPTA